MVTPRSASPKWVFIVLAIASALYSTVQSLAVPAIPLMQREFGASQGTAAWIFTSFLLAASVATPIVGRAGDLYGKRRLLVVSLLLLMLGSVLAAAAPNIGLLIAGRAIQGLSGGIVPLAFGILRDELPSRGLPQAIAIISSLLAVGFAVGMVASGLLAESIGFRWLFIVPSTMVAIVTALVMIAVPKRIGNGEGGVNTLAGVLMAGWLVLLLLGVSFAPSWGWVSLEMLAVALVTALIFAAWVVVELRAQVPLIDIRLMRTREIAAPNLVAFLIGMTMFGSLGYLPQMMQAPPSTGYGFGVSVVVAGLVLVPAAVASFVAGLLAVKLVNKWGTRLVISVGCAVASIGLVQLAFFHSELWHIALAVGVSNLGSGAVFACLANAVVAVAPKESVSMATGMNANIRTVGGSVGSAIVATLLVMTVMPDGFPALDGYIISFFILAGASAVAAIAALLIANDR